MSRVVWDQTALKSKLDYAEKKLIAVGLTLEGDIKRSISGPGPAPAGSPPGVDTGRLRASISTNWSGSGMTSGNVGSQALTEDGIDQPGRTADKFTVRVGSRVEYACLSVDTVVLTKEGWKRIAFVKKGDFVLTQTGDYHEVLDTIKIKNVERPDMVTIDVAWRKNLSRKLTMTKDHKVLVFRDGRNKWVCAGDLIESDLVYSLPKIASNKGPDVFCLNCGNTIKRNSNFSQKRKFCSSRCRADYWTKTGTNPHTNMKRSLVARAQMSVSGIKRAKEKPETHANHIMAQKGYETSTEKQVYDWLVDRKLKRKILRQYPVAGKFVDFYIPSLNTIYEADGAYWHKDQGKDIKRDKDILSAMPNVTIKHIHFFEERFSPKDMVPNPLPGVYYSACNPGPDSYVELSKFKTYAIQNIKHWKYAEIKKPKGSYNAHVYDLCIDKVHSYYANGVLVSNSWLEYGTRRMAARPFLRPAFDRMRVRIQSMITREVPGER